MKVPFSLSYGLRLLRGKGGTARYLRGAVIGVGLSLLPLVVVLEVSTGMIEGIMERLLEVKSYHLQVELGHSASLEAVRGIEKLVRSLPRVTVVVAERQGIGLLYSGSGATGVTVRAVPDDFLASDRGLADQLIAVSGRLEFPGPSVMLLGSAAARTLGVAAGDTVTLLTTFSGDLKGMPRASRFTVGGVFATGYEPIDKAFAYVCEAAGGQFMTSGNSTRFLGIKVRDPFDGIEGLADSLRNSLPPGLRVTSWTDSEGTAYRSFDATRTMLLFIMALVVIVASVNIFSSVLMLQIEKRLEIGILMGLGARPGDISVAFLLSGLVLGGMGTALGMALGLAVAVNINGCIAALQVVLDACVAFAAAVGGKGLGPITLFNSSYYLQEIPIRIGLSETLGIAFGTFLVSAVASYLPARRAGRQKPLDIIRKAS